MSEQQTDLTKTNRFEQYASRAGVEVNTNRTKLRHILAAYDKNKIAMLMAVDPSSKKVISHEYLDAIIISDKPPLDSTPVILPDNATLQETVNAAEELEKNTVITEKPWRTLSISLGNFLGEGTITSIGYDSKGKFNGIVVKQIDDVLDGTEGTKFQFRPLRREGQPEAFFYMVDPLVKKDISSAQAQPIRQVVKEGENIAWHKFADFSIEKVGNKYVFKSTTRDNERGRTSTKAITVPAETNMDLFWYTLKSPEWEKAFEQVPVKIETTATQ